MGQWLIPGRGLAQTLGGKGYQKPISGGLRWVLPMSLESFNFQPNIGYGFRKSQIHT